MCLKYYSCNIEPSWNCVTTTSDSIFVIIKEFYVLPINCRKLGSMRIFSTVELAPVHKCTPRLKSIWFNPIITCLKMSQSLNSIITKKWKILCNKMNFLRFINNLKLLKTFVNVEDINFSLTENCSIVKFKSGDRSYRFVSTIFLLSVLHESCYF